MEQETKQEHIELYLAGTLTGKELENFEQLLKEDGEFAKDFNIMKDVEEAFQDVPFEKSLTTQLQKFGNKYMPDQNAATAQPANRNIKPWIVGGIFVLALSLAGGSLIWINNTSNPSEPTEEQQSEENQIFASNMELYPTSQITRGEENTVSEEYQNAIDLYNDGAFDDAIDVLKSHIAVNDTDVQARILLGNCFLKTTPIQTERAIQTFEEIIDENSANLYKGVAEWYLALAYFENGQSSDAKKLLEKIATSKSKYTSKAQDILSGL